MKQWERQFFCTVRTLTFSIRTWRPRPPSWRDSWEACSKPVALPRFRAKNTGEPRFWLKSHKLSTLPPSRLRSSKPWLTASVRARHDRRGLQFAAALASRAVAAGEPISVAIDPATHALGELVPPGMLIAAPFRTSLTQGAVLIYPRQEGIFSAEEKSLISVVTGFAAVAISNPDLFKTAPARAYRLPPP